MYELFVSETCPYSIKVMEYFKENDIPYRKKAVSSPEIMEELIRLGGIEQVPFLYNPEDGTRMYESDEIIEYAERNK